MTKQITVTELRSLIEAARVEREYDHISTDEQYSGFDDQDMGPIMHEVDSYCVTQTVTVDGLKFFTQCALDVPVNKPTESSFIVDTGWDWITIENCDITVVDQDGDELEIEDAINYAISSNGNTQQSLEVADYQLSDWPYLAPATDPTTDPDADTDTDTETMNDTMSDLCSPEPKRYLVERDNQRNLAFSGWQIGFASSKSAYKSGRWTELALYRTVGGKYVAESVGYTIWQGERDRHSAQVCSTLAAVMAVFGYGPLGKEIYSDLGLDLESAEIVE